MAFSTTCIFGSQFGLESARSSAGLNWLYVCIWLQLAVNASLTLSGSQLAVGWASRQFVSCHQQINWLCSRGDGFRVPKGSWSSGQNTHGIIFSQSKSQGQPDGFKGQGKRPLFMGRATKYCGQPSSASGSRQASCLTSGSTVDHADPHLDSVIWPLLLPSYPYKHLAMEEPWG